MTDKKLFLPVVLIFLVCSLMSCANEFGQTVISQPDEYTCSYEASEKVILKAIARVFKEKNIGSNVKIDWNNLRVDSDYVVSGDWRTKANARVRRINWQKCEVSLIVTTESKTETGWEIRRLLYKEQYETIFNVIEMRIYEEMSVVE
ncbi:hypothetical protein ASZ90_006707 [hydrocarbon metagenome]|uniref:Lipoprotein n=1 Tax=hydrocarbon metagenome TaxID=938273 RepID=A0A0W8FRD6_9ZZZZ